MTFEEFMFTAGEKYAIEHKQGIRLGQSLMNHLWENNPIAYRAISGTEYDIFYNDDYYHATIQHLEKKWHDYLNRPIDICKVLKKGDKVSGELKNPIDKLTSFSNVDVVENNTEDEKFIISFDIYHVIPYKELSQIRLLK